MKKFYMNPELLVITLSKTDVIRTSTVETDGEWMPGGQDKQWGDVGNLPFVNKG